MALSPAGSQYAAFVSAAAATDTCGAYNTSVV